MKVGFVLRCSLYGTYNQWSASQISEVQKINGERERKRAKVRKREREQMRKIAWGK